jgi:hypothetical protein
MCVVLNEAKVQRFCFMVERAEKSLQSINMDWQAALNKK